MAVRGCSMNTIKYLMFFINGLVVLFTILWIVAAGMTLHDQSKHGSLVDVGTAPYITSIVIASFIFLLAFLACCGACTENRTMLNLYSGLLIIMLIVGFALVIVTYINRGKVKDLIKTSLDDAIKKYKTNEDTAKAFDELQTSLKCCGASKGAEDYTDIGEPIPASCCATDNSTTPAACTEKSKDFYKKNCVELLQEGTNYILGFLGAMAVLVFVVMIFGVTFSCCLRSAISDNYQAY